MPDLSIKIINKQYLIRILSLVWGFSFLVFSCTTPQNDAAGHYENAKKYFNAQEYEKAKIEFQNVIQLEPSNDQAQLDLAETYVHLQDPAKAAAAFQKALAMNPDNMKAKLRLGQILMLAGETRAARKTTDELLEKDPGNLEAVHLLASIQVQERNLSLALRTLEKALETNDTDPKTHLFAAHVLSAMNRLDEAESHYLKVLELDNTLRTPYVELAKLYRKKGEIEKIEPLIRKWVDVPGDPIQKSADLARFLESQGQIEKAEKKYLEASMNAPDDPKALLHLGSFYTRQKQYEKALEIFNRALNLDGKNLDIQSQIGVLLFLTKDYKKAEIMADTILMKNKNHEQANFLKGRIHFHRQEYSQAVKYFDLVISAAPDHARARFFKARCLLKKGSVDQPGQEIFRVAEGYDTLESWEREQAKEELIAALETDPNFLDARLLLIDILLGNKETIPARKHIIHILTKDPKNHRAMNFAGKLKLLEKDPEGAEKIYRSMLKVYPDDASGHVALGLALNEKGETEQAAASFDKALAINPNQMDALQYKISLYMQKKEVDNALAACEIHRKNFPPDSPSLGVIDLIQGRIYMSEGRINEAATLFKKAIERVPTLSAPYEQLAIIHEYRKEVPEAIQNYQQLLKLKPDYMPTYLNLSRIFKFQGDLKKAKNYLKMALTENSNFAPAANNLAFLLAQENSSLYEALRLAKEARDIEPKNPDYLDTLGWIYYLQGSNDLALATLEESVEQNPKNPLSQYHLGWAYYQNKEFEKARSHMKKALDLDPEFKDADKARDILGE